ncbi:hypothetical protein D9619_002637 [Psilocybe cf. subviscida]|uniref:Uncharacterized protein n=1 Tax=Psilocybe cf. subviscida TaxID=2480587 RepID=A0A8H5AWX4_9AGAR|nr:hypothetical protein D9619_002637 [Psilocybe cf. subviscida]
MLKPTRSSCDLKFIFSSTLLLPMPRKTIHETTDDLTAAHLAPTDGRASILVFISAQAIGSFGFALSLLAIWLGWLAPAAAANLIETKEANESQPRPVQRHSHHRSLSRGGPVPPTPPTPMRRVSAPVNLQPILSARTQEKAIPRHVYFADAEFPPLVRRNTIEGCVPTPPKLAPLAPLGKFMTSPLASTSILPPQESPEEHVPESDQSSKFNLQKPPSRLQKLKLFNKGTRIESTIETGKPGDQASITSTETSGNNSDKSTKRASGSGLPWTLSRNRTAPDVLEAAASASPSRICFSRRRTSPARPAPAAVPLTPSGSGSSGPSEVLSPSFLSRKGQKRVSAPIPRTSPYGAPYFASPPIPPAAPKYQSLNNKTQRQFDNEVHHISLPASDVEDLEFGRGRKQTSIRRVNLNNSNEPRPVPKRRSASEDCIYRNDTPS